MKAITSSPPVLALLLVACLVLAEMQAVLAHETPADGKASKTKKPKAPKIRRTIRLMEEPASVPALVKSEEPALEAPAQPQTVEMKNVGSTNQIDVKPNISITVPPAPVVSEPKEADEPSVQMVPLEPAMPQQPQPAQPDQLALMKQASSNKLMQLTADSGNQILNLGHNTGNVLSKVLSNSGNTETVHIDGVGNNKVTRISNAGNTEEQHVELLAPRAQAPAVAQLAPAAGLPLGGPLVQISMNNDGQVAPGKPVYNYVAGPAMPFGMRPPALVAPFGLPQMAMQSPMMMVQPAQAPMMMMMPQQQPMMMLSTMVTPRQWRRLMRAERKQQQHHHHCPHHHHGHEEKVKKDKKEKRSKKAMKEKKPKKEEQKVIEINHQEEEEEAHKPEEPKIFELIEPKIELPAITTTPTPKEHEKDEVEEVIEWETVRVPKKRKVMKPKRAIVL